MKQNELQLNEQEIAQAYADALRFVSLSRSITSDQTRQYMADAVRRFYDLLETRIEAKRTATVVKQSLPESAHAKIA